MSTIATDKPLTQCAHSTSAPQAGDRRLCNIAWCWSCTPKTPGLAGSQARPLIHDGSRGTPLPLTGTEGGAAGWKIYNDPAEAQQQWLQHAHGLAAVKNTPPKKQCSLTQSNHQTTQTAHTHTAQGSHTVQPNPLSCWGCAAATHSRCCLLSRGDGCAGNVVCQPVIVHGQRVGRDIVTQQVVKLLRQQQAAAAAATTQQACSEQHCSSQLTQPPCPTQQLPPSP